MPRAFSSGALSIESKLRNLFFGLCLASTLVIAAVNVVLPWSTCPMVPMLTCGLLRSNFSLLMCVPSKSLSVTAELLDQRLRHRIWGRFVMRKLHRVRRPSLSPRTEVGGIAEHHREGNLGVDYLCVSSLGGADDLSAPGGQIAHHVAHRLLGSDDLRLHHRLQQHRRGLVAGVLEGDRARDLEA